VDIPVLILLTFEREPSGHLTIISVVTFGSDAH